MLEIDFEGPVPINKTDEGKGRELRLADTKARAPSCRLHGLQGPVLTENISRREFTRDALFLKPQQRVLRLWLTRMAREEGGEAEHKRRFVKKPKKPLECALFL